MLAIHAKICTLGKGLDPGAGIGAVISGATSISRCAPRSDGKIKPVQSRSSHTRADKLLNLSKGPILPARISPCMATFSFTTQTLLNPCSNHILYVICISYVTYCTA
ncbi:hypothetical protein XENTR_v10004291 [Xenopus tropicalis]|nr:hypothetical protein XENTR_v10004291 [Xenopus tropicalis]